MDQLPETHQRLCSGCSRWLGPDRFYTHPGSVALRRECKYCAAGRQLERFYKVSRQGFNAMVAAQDGRCGLCEEPAWPLRVDHDHSCCPGQVTCGACVRKLLCENCNKGLGMLMDDAGLLRAAANYVEAYRG